MASLVGLFFALSTSLLGYGGYAKESCLLLPVTDPVDARFESYNYYLPNYGLSASLPGKPENITYEQAENSQLVIKNTSFYRSPCETVEYRTTVLDGGGLKSYSPSERKEYESTLTRGMSKVDPSVVRIGSRLISGRYFTTFVFADTDAGGKYIRQGAYYVDWQKERVFLLFLYYSRTDNTIDAGRAQAIVDKYLSNVKIDDQTKPTVLKQDQGPITNLISIMNMDVDLPPGWDVWFYSDPARQNEVGLMGKDIWIHVFKSAYRVGESFTAGLENGDPTTYLNNRVKQWKESEASSGTLNKKSVGYAKNGQEIFELEAGTDSKFYTHSLFINGEPGVYYTFEPCQREAANTTLCQPLTPEQEKEVITILRSVYVAR